MAKINLLDAGKFGTQGANDFFTLADDGDVARVRFLYEEPDGSDIDYYLVHEVEIQGKKRYVACLGLNEEGHLNPHDCPLCSAGVKRIEKLFLQLYVEEEDAVKTWDRGRTFVQKILTYINRYGSLCAQPIEIERRGKKGDTNTTYELFPLEKDGKTLADLPEKQQLLGSFILQLTPEECEDVLDGVYVIPGSEDEVSSQRRSGERGRRTSSGSRQTTTRQTESRSVDTEAAPRRTRTRTRSAATSDQF